MKLDLTAAQAQQAVRDFLANVGEEDSEAVAIRLPDSVPIRIAVARHGGLTVYTGADAVKIPGKKAEKKAPKKGGDDE